MTGRGALRGMPKSVSNRDELFDISVNFFGLSQKLFSIDLISPIGRKHRCDLFQREASMAS
jgi:hypothetical protein